ncbi:hypothetical protein TeGR_g1041 [Tetraparma gracilis]|uniref:Transmembrane protein n=1 Tax=Tetraparma gracilis TaxID=2962635 RepID=A0ABQ6N718_9STRA|nr:hypothetical protein TeGR_g1041 [Tetraparma gracilis]
MSCFYSPEEGDVDDIPTCHCASIAILSQEDWPVCETRSSMSWAPILVCVLTNLLCMLVLGWGAWILKVLHTLKQLQFNDITQAMLLALAGATFVWIHQALELAQMFMLDKDVHEVIYANGGILQICLAGLGGCIVMACLKVPLLWISIASAGMDKAKAKKDKLFVKRLCNYSSGFFLLTFLAIMFMTDTSTGGSYAILWLLILIGAFQIGARKLRKSLQKPGEETPKTIKDINAYVLRFTVLVLLYIGAIVGFLSVSSMKQSNPRDWWIWAGAIYHLLGQVTLTNLIYIRHTLDKKLQKFKETGKVAPSTVVSSSSESS